MLWVSTTVHQHMGFNGIWRVLLKKPYPLLSAAAVCSQFVPSGSLPSHPPAVTSSSTVKRPVVHCTLRPAKCPTGSQWIWISGTRCSILNGSRPKICSRSPDPARTNPMRFVCNIYRRSPEYSVLRVFPSFRVLASGG